MFAVVQKEIRLQLHPNLNKKSELFLVYLKDDSLKHEIEKLQLEDGTRFASLAEELGADWDSAATFLIQEASTRRQYNDKSTIVQDVAGALLHAVEKHRSDRPHEVKNESIRKQHHRVVAVILVEAVYEICTGRAGAFAPALFGTRCRELALKTAQRQRSSKKTNASRIHALEKECEVKDAEIALLKQQQYEFNVMHQEACKTKDAEITKLKQNMGGITELCDQLRRATLGEEANAEPVRPRESLNQNIGPIEELCNQLRRATLGEEVKSELVQLRESLKGEEVRFVNMRDHLTSKVKDLEDQVKVADDRAERALSVPHARDFINAKIDCDLQVMDAKEFAKQEKRTAMEGKRIAKQEIMRAMLWKEEYSGVLDDQWMAFGRMPHALWVLFQPYITIPASKSNAESLIERKIAFSGL